MWICKVKASENLKSGRGRDVRMRIEGTWRMVQGCVRGENAKNLWV